MVNSKHTRSVLFGFTLVLVLFMTNGAIIAFAQSSVPDNTLVGAVMKGGVVNQKQAREATPLPPANYFDESFKLIKEAGLNHVRFLYYWEAYEKNPELFMKELDAVANAADKYGIKVIYDNHQWHTSSWLEKRGTGFPVALFENNSLYPKDGGGNIEIPAKKWWSNFWDRSIKDAQGNDAWKLQSDFMKKVVTKLDSHPSTFGYEILSEPHVDTVDEWAKIGKFNSFMADELRKVTQKAILYSMNVPVDLKGPINLSPENLAKMAPTNKENVMFKISVYGVPDRDQYQKQRFDIFLKTRELTGIPLYVGEWNNVVRTPVNGVFTLDPTKSGLNQDNTNAMLQSFKKQNVSGSAFWKWDYNDAPTASFNLVLLQNGTLVPTQYYTILKNAVATVH